MLGKARSGRFLLGLVLIWTAATLLLADTAFAGVKRLIDQNGTIIITNQKQQTAKSSTREVASPPSQNQAQPAPRVIPASFPASETPNRPTPATAAAPPDMEPIMSLELKNEVTCKQDDKGVWHITNIPPAEKVELNPVVEAGAPAAEGLALKSRLQPAGVTLASAREARPLTKEGQTALSIQKSPPNSSQVQTRRKKDGTIVITNLAPLKSLPEQIHRDLEPILTEAAWHYALPVPLIRALIKVESNFNPAAVSPKGAMGLMQLMPGTASDLGVRDPYCVRENVLAGCRYFRYLLDMFNQSLPLALAAYNAGSQRVVNAGYRVPGIKETQEFVTSVLENYCTENPKALAGDRGFPNRRGNTFPTNPGGQIAQGFSPEAALPVSQDSSHLARRVIPATFLAARTPNRLNPATAAAAPDMRAVMSLEPKREVTCRKDDQGVWRITNIPPPRQRSPLRLKLAGKEGSV